MVCALVCSASISARIAAVGTASPRRSRHRRISILSRSAYSTEETRIRACFAGQPHRVAADGIRQTIHRAVGHNTIQRGRAHTVARHLPLLREQARCRCRGVVRRQAEIAISNEIERVRHSPAFHLRTAPIQRARLRVAHKLNRHGGIFAVFKREADTQALPAGSKRANAPVRRAAECRTAFVDGAICGHLHEGTLIAAGNGKPGRLQIRRQRIVAALKQLYRCFLPELAHPRLS